MNTPILRPNGWAGLDGPARLTVGYAIAEKLAYELDAKQWPPDKVLVLFEALESLMPEMPKGSPAYDLLESAVGKARIAVQRAITSMPKRLDS